MFEHFSPINDQILVKVLPSEEKEGSIIIPEKARERGVRAEVLAVGPGSLRIRDGCAACGIKGQPYRNKPDVEVGQLIWFHPAVRSYMAREAEVDAQDQRETIIIREDSVLAVIEPA